MFTPLLLLALALMHMGLILKPTCKCLKLNFKWRMQKKKTTSLMHPKRCHYSRRGCQYIQSRLLISCNPTCNFFRQKFFQVFQDLSLTSAHPVSCFLNLFLYLIELQTGGSCFLGKPRYLLMALSCFVGINYSNFQSVRQTLGGTLVTADWADAMWQVRVFIPDL